MREIATGLQFPEGPIAVPDGSVVLVEIRRRTLSRVQPDGTVEVIAELGGGPNGAAIGPDGRCYVCNNGGFEWEEIRGRKFPSGPAVDYTSGSIQAVDLETGEFETLYTECEGHPLKGPNDLVFDSAGGFWFTDHGKVRERDKDRTGIFYARPDGSHIVEAAFPVESPNGIGLSPEGDRVYAAETPTGRVFYWDIAEPGVIATNELSPNGGHFLAGVGGLQMFDSLAIDGDGNVCVATLINGGVTSISPNGEILEHFPTGDSMTTNVCFGGGDLRTAYITLSGRGALVAVDWPRAGLKLEF
ncbi:MAG: SMP-30/gluconolactonase/LRE family protein [Acidobacteriota bacterium]|nr:SMP-30/gluconolactonase/LRE family protein [Acidobacteriota bacterium]